MKPVSIKRAARAELDLLLRQGLVTPKQYDGLKIRYPHSDWDYHSLGRWFLIFGAVNAALGGSILFHKYVGFDLRTGSVLLALGTVFLLLAGQALKRRGLVMTARAAELLSGFSVIGLTYTLALMHASGSDRWAAPLLPDLLVLLAMSYALVNPLLLVLSIVVFFVWFGGETAYMWGGYFFGMNYPLRFLAAALVMCAVAVLHIKAEAAMLAPFRAMSKIWLSSGIFFAEMSLWILSIFGDFGSMDNYRYEAQSSELFSYNLIWGLANGFLIWLGAERSIRMLVGYGVTFLVIQLYTLFFEYAAASFGPLFSALIAGGSALWLASFLEKKRKMIRDSSAA